jgi:phosphatidate cytidylyltransferase
VSELARRVLVALIGAPLAIALVWLGGWWLIGLLALLGGAGAWELYRMASRSGISPFVLPGIATAAALPVYARMTELGQLQSPATIAAIVVLSLLGGALWVRGVEGRPLEAVAVTVFGAVYAGGLLSWAYLLRHHRFVASDLAGTALVMYPIAVTWASDIGAYFVGRWLGRAKLMPSISPGKTVAGAIGALVIAALASAAYDGFVLGPYAQLGVGTVVAIVLGVVVSGAAQIGDLVESMLKREAGVKDSSGLLPGHGGILDRLDSLYFVLPVSYLLLGRLLVVVSR